MGQKILAEIATVLVLLHLGLLATAQECTEGEIRTVTMDSTAGVRPFPQLCYGNQWRLFCDGRGIFASGITFQVICRQLNYSCVADTGLADPQVPTANFARPLEVCNGTEDRVQECGGIRDLADCNNPLWVQCASEASIRLVDGSSENEGQVEVCVDGEFGTVCNNQEGLAGAVCAQLGFPEEGAQQMTFGGGYVNNSCTVQNGSLNCTEATNATCNNTMDLEVVCRTCEELYNELLMTCPTPTDATTQPGDDNTTPQPCDCPQTDNTNGNTACSTGAPVTGGQSIALGVIVGILVAVIIAMTIGWICTCIFMRRQSTVVMSDKRLSPVDSKTPPPRTAPQPPAQEMAIFDDPTYDVAIEPGYNATGPTGVYSVLDQKRTSQQPNQGEDYNVLNHSGNHGNQVPGQEEYNTLTRNDSNQPPVNAPQEEYAKLDR